MKNHVLQEGGRSSVASSISRRKRKGSGLGSPRGEDLAFGPSTPLAAPCGIVAFTPACVKIKINHLKHRHGRCLALPKAIPRRKRGCRGRHMLADGLQIGLHGSLQSTTTKQRIESCGSAWSSTSNPSNRTRLEQTSNEHTAGTRLPHRCFSNEVPLKFHPSNKRAI